jgi:hypothetical protein
MAKGTSDYASGYALYSGSPVSFAQAISSAPIVVAQPIYCAVVGPFSSCSCFNMVDTSNRLFAATHQPWWSLPPCG